MFNFDHLAPVKTARLSLGLGVRTPGCDKPITLIVRHAGDGNPGWLNAVRTTPLAQDQDGANARLAKLIAKHAIVGWESVTAPDGSSIPFTADAAEKLLLAFISAHRSDVVRYVHAYATEPDNFHDPVPSAGDLGKA